MRVVEHEKNTGGSKYQIVRGIGITAGIFALVLCVLIIVNNTHLRNADPMASPALARLMEELSDSPEDMELREQIRELDLLARRAYFAGERFNQIGIVLLLVCLAVMVGALKYAGQLIKGGPYPDSSDPKRDLVAEGRFARRAFGMGWLVLVGFTLALAIPWESPLDESGAESAEAEEMVVETGPVEALPAAPPPPTREELLRNWPAFLGPAAAVVPGAAPPIPETMEEAVVWKTPIPLSGFSSPIIWEGALFLSGGSEEKCEVYCFDVETGVERWRRPVEGFPGSPTTAPKVTADTGYAAATMATDGNAVFAVFANGDLVAFDLDGEQVWGRNLGVPDNPYGHASSLVIFEDLLLVQYDHREAGFLYGIDLHSGEARWETKRDLGASWATPLVFEHDGKPQVVLNAAGAVVSYDPRTGDERWRVECLDGAEVACTPTYADGFIYVAADYAAVVAIDLASQSIAWEYADLVPGVATPLAVGEYLVCGLSDGGIACLNAMSGEEVWFEVTDDGFYASPVLVGEDIYLVDRAGVMHVFTPGEEFKSIIDTPFEEEVVCTPAFVGGDMYVRGVSHLYRIGSDREQ